MHAHAWACAALLPRTRTSVFSSRYSRALPMVSTALETASTPMDTKDTRLPSRTRAASAPAPKGEEEQQARSLSKVLQRVPTQPKGARCCFWQVLQDPWVQGGGLRKRGQRRASAVRGCEGARAAWARAAKPWELCRGGARACTHLASVHLCWCHAAGVTHGSCGLHVTGMPHSSRASCTVLYQAACTVLSQASCSVLSQVAWSVHSPTPSPGMAEDRLGGACARAHANFLRLLLP